MSRTPLESSDQFGVPANNAGSGGSSDSADVFMSRREARAARESAAIIPLVPAEHAAQNNAIVVGLSAEGAGSAAHTARAVLAATPRLRAAVASARHRRRPIRAVASMVVIGGLFAVAGLPAYGSGDLVPGDGSAVASADAVAGVTTASAQSVSVSADLEVPLLERDRFTATTPEDLAIIQRQAATASQNAVYAASGARALGDDYPWATAGYELSPLNYYLRQCTDFVAWRLNRDAGSFSAPFRWAWVDLTPNGGDASQWKSAWQAHGWTVSATPIVGSVAWFGSYNHVSYVKKVNADGSVLLEEYNYSNRVYGQRTLAASDVEAFLYPPGQ